MTRARILPLAILATLALATPAQAAKSVKGKWKGTVHARSVAGNRFSFPMRLTIKRTKVGSTAGTLSNPGSPCHSQLTVASRHDGGLSLQYHEKGFRGEQLHRRRQDLRRCARARSCAGARSRPDGQVGTATLQPPAVRSRTGWRRSATRT